MKPTKVVSLFYQFPLSYNGFIVIKVLVLGNNSPELLWSSKNYLLGWLGSIGWTESLGVGISSKKLPDFPWKNPKGSTGGDLSFSSDLFYRRFWVDSKDTY